MFFASDNSGPVHPRILEALAQVNSGYALGYGNDDITRQVREMLCNLFETDQAEIWLVGTGTAANVLALSAMVTSFQSVYCSPVAHIHEDECNGFEFYSGGGKLVLVGENDKMTPDALERYLLFDLARGQVPAQLGALSLTQATERGRIYSCDEVRGLTQVAQSHNLPVHMDGARFANAVAALDCTPAEITWKAGVSALSFGGTKNGCMGVEAVIFFDPAFTHDMILRRQRAGHTFSKHRYLAAQMLAYLDNDLWLELAHTSNEKRTRLEAGLRQINTVRISPDPQANMIFAHIPEAMHQRLQEAGATYYNQPCAKTGLRPIRLVCDWSIADADIDRFLKCAASK